MSPSTPKVSAILISYNRSADLRLSIEALLASGYPDLEIVVVDNASTDDAADVAASFPGVKLIRSKENLGFAEGNNVGLRAATGAYLALVNNDAVVDPTWIRSLVDFLEAHPDAAAAGGKAYFWDDDSPLGRRENRYYSYTLVEPDTGYTHAQLDTPDEEREVATLSGCAVMIRRAAVDSVCSRRMRTDAEPPAASVGAPPEPFLEPVFFTYYEETDFFARAIRRGWKLFYLGEPAVWHRIRASSQPYRYFYFMDRNRLLLAYRNFSDTALRLVMAKTVSRALNDVTHRPLRMIRGDGDDVRARRDAYGWILQNHGLLRRMRAEIAGIGVPYEEVVNSIQGRAGYFGHPRPEVAALVPEGARNVVDIGCGAGALGKGLKAARPELAVRGVEPVPEQAARAREVLDEVVVAGAEDPLPSGWPRPDCVIFADVLEHLVDPWAVLRSLRPVLAPGGSLVISVPNIAHRSVMGGLLRGRWDYQEAGVLDRTHLRFFTRETAIELVEQAGFVVKRVERVLDLREERFAHPTLLRAARKHMEQEGTTGRRAGRRTAASMIAELCTIQFLIVAS